MKKIVNLIIIIVLLSLFIFVILEGYLDENISKKADIKIVNNNLNGKIVENIKQYEKVDYEEFFNGYKVCAKLEIPSISLNTNILEEYSEEALKVSPTKFWGVNANEIGNFCVVGHNFINKNMFHDLKNLNIGDNFYISDKKVGKVEYEIFSIYKVLPDDTSPLDSITLNEREVTLITCTSDSKERIIIKAKEKI